MAAAAEALEEGEIREALSLLQTVPEPVEQDLTTENQIHESFTAGKSVVAAHNTKVTDDMPDAKMTVKQLRYDLIHHMYSEDELRELADGEDARLQLRHEVDRVLASRGTGSGMQYLVKWKHCAAQDATWEASSSDAMRSDAARAALAAYRSGKSHHKKTDWPVRTPHLHARGRLLLS